MSERILVYRRNDFGMLKFLEDDWMCDIGILRTFALGRNLVWQSLGRLLFRSKQVFGSHCNQVSYQ